VGGPPRSTTTKRDLR